MILLQLHMISIIIGSLTYTAPLDFTAISNRAITLDADRMSQPVSVTIMNDTHLENDETFVGQIVLQGENNQVVIDRDETTITIVDDDGKKMCSS